MYFTADTGEGPHLWRQKSDGETAEQITNGPTTEEGIAVAPDGRSIVSSVGTARSSVWIHDASGDRQISSEGDAESPYFSADGTRVFYLLRRGAGQTEQLAATEVSSGRCEPVLPGVSMVDYIVSRDGQALAYSSRDGSGSVGLWYAQLDQRSAPRKLVPSGVVAVGAIGASGDIFYSAQDGHGYRIGLDGKGSRQIASTMLRLAGGPVISPDEEWASWQGSVYPLSGGKPVTLGRVVLRWSPDGKAAVISSSHNGESVTCVIPLRGNSMLPATPPGGIRNRDDLKKSPVR